MRPVRQVLDCGGVSKPETATTRGRKDLSVHTKNQSSGMKNQSIQISRTSLVSSTLIPQNLRLRHFQYRTSACHHIIRTKHTISNQRITNHNRIVMTDAKKPLYVLKVEGFHQLRQKRHGMRIFRHLAFKPHALAKHIQFAQFVILRPLPRPRAGTRSLDQPLEFLHFSTPSNTFHSYYHAISLFLATVPLRAY